MNINIDFKYKKLIVFATLCIGIFMTDTVLVKADTIPKGVTIEGIEVGGMSVNDARSIMDIYAEGFSEVQFTFESEAGDVIATASEVGLYVKNPEVAQMAADYGVKGNLFERYNARRDLESGKTKDYKIALGINRATVRDFLEENAKKLNREAIDFGLSRDNGEFVVIDGMNGVGVDYEKSANRFSDYIDTNWDGMDATFSLSTEIISPRGSIEQLSYVTDVLGSYVTDYSTSSASRKINVENGTKKLNGILLYPGDEWSVYQTLLPFNEKNGYALAAGYENGTTVDTYGGGICQVSSTLYGAVRAAEVNVMTRAAHSMIVSYVEPSMDAAISGGKDLQLRNQREYPIYIEGYISNNKVYFNIYGKEDRDPNRQVSYESEITSQEDPIIVYQADASQNIGSKRTLQSSHTGYTARLWKIVTVDGVEVSRDVYNNSKYNVSNKIVAIGTNSSSTTAVSAMNRAIETQDTAIIEEAINRYTGYRDDDEYRYYY